MKRREFITVVGGGAAAWLLKAHAQQPDQMRRIGILVNNAEADPETKAQLVEFRQGLQRFGW
jgi:putative ABC transport system substrate-binding protein